MLIILVPVALARTWVLDGDGAGDASTLRDALDLLSTGDTLDIRPGTYLLEEPGAYEAARSDLDDITIRGAGPDTTILDGAALGKDLFTGVEFTGEAVEVQGLTFRNFATTAGALLSGTGNGLSSLTVEGCLFEANGYTGAHGDGEQPALGVFGGDLTVIDSVFLENDGAIGVENGWVDRLWVENSIFVGNRMGIAPSIVDGRDEGGTQWVIANNTFIGGDTAFRFSTDSTQYHYVDVVLANNVFADTGESWYVYMGCGLCGFTGVFTNNLLANGVEGSLIDDYDVVDVVESGTIHADPTFVSWSDDGDDSNDDLHLAFGSPGIDQGVDGYADEDLDGRARPVDGDLDGTATTDIGAYEYAPDADGDGHDALDAGGDDCDDGDAAVHPGAPDLCDGVDGDCDGDDVPAGVECAASDCGCASAPPHGLAFAAMAVVFLFRSRAPRST